MMYTYPRWETLTAKFEWHLPEPEEELPSERKNGDGKLLFGELLSEILIQTAKNDSNIGKGRGHRASEYIWTTHTTRRIQLLQPRLRNLGHQFGHPWKKSRKI